MLRLSAFNKSITYLLTYLLNTAGTIISLNRLYYTVYNYALIVIRDSSFVICNIMLFNYYTKIAEAILLYIFEYIKIQQAM